MFGNMLMTGLVTPLSQTDETTGWENRPFKTIYPQEMQRTCNTGKQSVTKTIRKKPKRIRTAYTTDQLRTLEKVFTRSRYVDAEQRRLLAQELNVGDKAIKVWFQNRRMKEKRHSESSCDSSVESYASLSPNSIQNDIKVEDINQVPNCNIEPFQEPVNTTFQCYQVNEASDPSNFEQYQGQYVANHNCPEIKQNLYQNVDSTQYQLPNFQYQCYPQYHHYNAQAITSFCNDVNAYPIEYYPNTQHTNQTDSQHWANEYSEISHYFGN